MSSRHHKHGNSATKEQERALYIAYVIELSIWIGASTWLFFSRWNQINAGIPITTSALMTVYGAATVTAIIIPLIFLVVTGCTPIVIVLYPGAFRHRLFSRTPFTERDEVVDEYILDTHTGRSIAERQLQHNLRRSFYIYKSSYQRARIHLLAALILALLGPICIFGWQYAITTDLTTLPRQAGSALVEQASHGGIFGLDLTDILPRLSVFIFLEIVAGFFMKQYGKALDQSLEFEKIYHHRELEFVSLLILTDKDLCSNERLARYATQLISQDNAWNNHAPGNSTADDDPFGNPLSALTTLQRANRGGS
jgi:hypothetical protein